MVTAAPRSRQLAEDVGQAQVWPESFLCSQEFESSNHVC